MNNFALIVGAMKCGTTSLFSYLAQHPQISPCTRKEPCFFSKEKRWSKGFEWYCNLWDWDSNKHKIALEASTSYTRIPIYLNAAERIATIDKKFKFIYIIRNPIDRIESHYTYAHALGYPEGKRPLSEFIDSNLIETSRYAKQIEEYYQRFSSNSILLLDFDDLQTDPLNLLKKICQFLDIDPDYNFQGLNEKYNANQGRIGYSKLWDFLRSNKRIRLAIKNIIPKQQKQILHRFFASKLEGNMKLSSAQKKYILQELQEDLYQLKSKYNFNIDNWMIKVD